MRTIVEGVGAMVDLPVVVVGCPVQNREFVIEEYLDCVYNLDYPKDKLIPAFFVNNSNDGTGQIIQHWLENHEKEYLDIGYLEKKRVYKGKTDSQKRDKRDFTLFAVVRNLFIKYILSFNFDYFFSYDSDILIPPHTLKQLLSHDKDICSILVWNGISFGKNNYNYRKWMQSRTGKWNYYLYEIQPSQLFEVDITGACYLMKKDVLDSGVKYKAHRFGEDWEFCMDAKKNGFKLYVDPTINNEHKARWE